MALNEIDLLGYMSTLKYEQLNALLSEAELVLEDAEEDPFLDMQSIEWSSAKTIVTIAEKHRSSPCLVALLVYRSKFIERC